MSVRGTSPAPPVHWSRSLRVRLLAVTLAGVAVAMVLAGLVLSGLFREHVQQQFQAGAKQLMIIRQ